MGTFDRLKIGILTSSRSDYSIYFPLLLKLNEDSFFVSEVIVFGTHLMKKFGYTVQFIYKDGFKIVKVPNTMYEGDLPENIAHSIGQTIQKFSWFYSKKKYDLLLALGDRYELFAAVTASIPFNIPIAHIHGGESTLGAIDNRFRHSITCFSSLHFVSTEIYKKRVAEITGSIYNIFNVGALSIDNLKNLRLYNVTEFKKIFNIDMTQPTILMTFHPETVGFERNEFYIGEIINALEQLTDYQLIITMPNADTMGLIIRKKLEQFGKNRPQTWLIESFGTVGYLSALKHCAIMMGNSSSGFVEAAFFPKRVINLGDRQKGRILTDNIIQTPIIAKSILEAVQKAERLNLPTDCNIYGNGMAADKIIDVLKKGIQK